MSFEVMAKTMPMHHSSIPIEVVVLDSLQQTNEMLHEMFARSILTEEWRRPRPRERLAMADNRQLLRLQGWKDGYDRWSQSQDFTDFDQCILRPKDNTQDFVNKKNNPAVCRW